MIYLFSKSIHLSFTIFQVILIINQIFIPESTQQRITSTKLFRGKHSSLYFYDFDSESFTGRQRSLIQNQQNQDYFDENRGGATLSSRSGDPIARVFTTIDQKIENILSEEVVDPRTASDELEISVSAAVNFKTQFESHSPLSRYLLKNCGKSKAIGQRIVNGDDVEEGMYPWTVAVLKYGDPWCGGAILNRQWIISASHCFMKLMDPKAYAVRVGSVNRNSGTSYKIKKLIMHERFHLDNMYNSDIALLKVERPIKFGPNVNSVCLPSTPFEEPRTTTLIVVGWGASESGNTDLPVILQEVTLDRISDGTCSRKYQAKSNTIYKSQVCTFTERKDACQGDSGGPAIEIQNSRAILIGIVSYGSKCADEYPGVYTQVSYFLTWIKTQLDRDKKESGG